MTRKFLTAACFTIFAATGAFADQFVVQLDSAYENASENLKDLLKISEVESFSTDGKHYVILDAPSEAYVEAFFIAIHRQALELSVLEADWSRPVMSELSMSQRLDFLEPIECEFCAS